MKRIITLAALFALFISSVYAQNIRILTDTTQTPDIYIDEITVKSPKESRQVTEVPASISLISAQNLQQNQVNNLTDISSRVPNLFMMDYGSKLQSPIFIRGIGSRLGTPSVGLYVDHVPYFEKTAFGFDFFDIERIEVLRGPQGTLYGRNTMGGIINVFSKSPLFYEETNLTISGGSHGYFGANVNHYNKLSDKVGISVSANYNQHDGYFTNSFDGSSADDQYTASARARLVWKISQNWMLENIASFENSEQYGFPYAKYDAESGNANAISINQESSYKRDMFSNGLVLKYHNEDFEFISTTSYQFYDGVMAVDQDFTADSIYYFSIGDRQNLLSQELVIKATPEKKYKWLFGAYGFYQNMDQHTSGNLYKHKIAQDIRSGFDISGLALYHQSTFENFLVENLSLTAGIRLDMEKDKLDYEFMQAVGGSPKQTLTDKNYKETFVEVLPKVAVKYAFNKNASVYATISKGYKSGGFNTNSSIQLEDNLSYDSEKSLNYELGFKSLMADNKLQLDAALFYIDWKDQQIDVPVPTGRGNMKTNAGESVSKGVELFVRARPVRNLEATLGYGYTHATFSDYVVKDDLNYNDNTIPYVPRSTVNAGLAKTFEVKNSFLDKVVANLSYRGVGKHYWNLDNSIAQDYYGLVDGKLSFVAGKMQLDIWAKNIFDTSYNSYYFVISSLQNSYVQHGKPATMGVNLKVKF